MSYSACFSVVTVGLHDKPAFIGVLMTIQGVGAIVGGLTAARLLLLIVAAVVVAAAFLVSRPVVGAAAQRTTSQLPG